MPKNFLDTPLMRQYAAIKARHPDAMLLFRVGDFYETYREDAPICARILGITLTQRSGTNPELGALAGFPYHALDSYLPKLVRAGIRVAVCDQLEDPKQAKGIVKRGITELVTPGVVMTDGVLDAHENNFLAAVNMTPSLTGVAFLDISTGEFLIAQGEQAYVDRLLSNFRPKEVLFRKGLRQSFVEAFGSKWTTYAFDDWAFNQVGSRDRLLRHFGTHSLKGFGVEELPEACTAAGAVLAYLDVTEHQALAHVSRLQRVDEQTYVALDRFTQRNLELLNDGRDGCVSLSDIEDRATTPMGSRLLKRWLTMPLRDLRAIGRRLDVTQTFVQHPDLRDRVAELLSQVGDLERLVAKTATARIAPREVVQLARSLDAIPAIKEAITNEGLQGPLLALVTALDDCDQVRQRIRHDIVPEPPTTIQKPGVIAAGVAPELDELRGIHSNAKAYIADMQEKLASWTGIPSLKVGFTSVFGYYIEVRNTYKARVPADWERKQTMTGAERYITPELKEYEQKVLGAEQRIAELETQLYSTLLTDLGAHVATMQTNATRLAELDTLHTFARNAVEFDYTRPEIDESEALDIQQGRHPVIERLMPPGENYVPNDMRLDKDEQQIVIVTGPNMAGKSALLRQTALIVLLAQCGSFVPAKAAKVGVVDKIFTRVGASDNLSMGESTFMVEMTEAASILNNVTPRSLVLFDELGRGTSTYDGISLAWSIVEFLHNVPRAQARTLFATHYHELNDLEKMYDKIKNYNVSVHESGGKVLFLRKLVRGGSAHSFGIHVARLAGMPASVVERAEEILRKLESERDEVQVDSLEQMADAPEGSSTEVAVPQLPEDNGNEPGDGGTTKSEAQPEPPTATATAAGKMPSFKKTAQKADSDHIQLSFFQLDDPLLRSIRDQIAGLDINKLTPLDALNKLSDIKRLLGI